MRERPGWERGKGPQGRGAQRRAAAYGRRFRPLAETGGSAGAAGRDPGGGQALVLTHSLANSTKRRAAGPVSAGE